MAAHRYWRVRGRAISGALSCGELELRGAVGGPDLTGSGAAIASSEFSGSWVAGNAFNNVTMPGWSATASDPDPWIGYDFGVGGDVELFEIAWTSRTDGSLQTNPESISVEWSDDAVTWVSAASLGGIAAWSSGETRTYEWATSDPNQDVNFYSVGLEVAASGGSDVAVRFHSVGLEVAYSLEATPASGSWKPQINIIVT